MNTLKPTLGTSAVTCENQGSFIRLLNGCRNWGTQVGVENSSPVFCSSLHIRIHLFLWSSCSNYFLYQESTHLRECSDWERMIPWGQAVCLSCYYLQVVCQVLETPRWVSSTWQSKGFSVILEGNIKSVSIGSQWKISGAWWYCNLPFNGFLRDNQNTWKSFSKNSALSQT